MLKFSSTDNYYVPSKSVLLHTAHLIFTYLLTSLTYLYKLSLYWILFASKHIYITSRWAHTNEFLFNK